MASVYEGIGEGFERGLRIGSYIAEAPDRKRQRERSRKREDMQDRLSEMQLQTLQDEKRRTELKRDNDALLYSLSAMKNNPDGYANYLKTNPQEAQRLQAAIQNVGNFAFTDTGKAGKVTVIDLDVIGEKDGEPLFGVKVTNEQGAESYITDDRKKMGKNGKPTTYTLDELGQNGAALNALISQIESRQVAMGDQSPLERQRRGLAAASEQQFQAQQSALDFERQKVLKGIAPEKSPRPQKIGTDPMTGMDVYGMYDPASNSFKRVTERVGFSGLPSDQQDAMAIKSLEEQGVKKQKQTYFGLGEPEYSDEQRSAEIGRLSLQDSGVGQAGLPMQDGQAGAPGVLRKEGDIWTNSQGQTVQMTAQGPMVVQPKSKRKSKPDPDQVEPQEPGLPQAGIPKSTTQAVRDYIPAGF